MNRNLRRQRNRRKKLKRVLTKVAVVQLLMVIFFVFWIAACTPKDADELTTASVKVVSADRYPFNTSLFTIYSDSDTYFVSSAPNKGETSVREMEKEIFPGDILSITYYEHLGRNQIVDLRSDTKVYRSVDKMNEHLRTGLTISYIFIAIVELVYILSAIFYIRLSVSFPPKKKKQK